MKNIPGYQKEDGIMKTMAEIINDLYYNPYLLPLIPALAVLADYGLTFYLADNYAMILSWEASPLVRYAAAHGLMVIYLAGIMLFYYITSYFVLRLLAKSPVYPVGVTLLVIISLTHILGGLSWYFRNSLYSNIIFGLSVMSIVVAIGLFGYVTFQQIRHPAVSN
jgi:hypothetical protein